jgi:hypothetical protein
MSIFVNRTYALKIIVIDIGTQLVYVIVSLTVVRFQILTAASVKMLHHVVS